MNSLKYSILLFLSIFLFDGIRAESLHWNKERGYNEFRYGGKEGIYIDNKTDTLQYDYYSIGNTDDLMLKFRARNLHGHPTRKYQYRDGKGKILNQGNPHWGFFITGTKETIAITVKGGERMSAGEPEPAMIISVYNVRRSYKETLYLTKDIDPYDGDNLWSAEVKEGQLHISAGNHSLKEIFISKCQTPIIGFGFFAGWGDELLVSDISLEFSSSERFYEGKLLQMPNLDEYLQNSEDSLEGYWTLFDRELEENLLKIGGNYNLVCIKEGETYLFYYLDGGTVNSKNWNKGDLKIVMTPSPFDEIYDVEWIDAMKEPMKKDIKAQKGEGSILTIQFPYQSSKLRLRKMNP